MKVSLTTFLLTIASTCIGQGSPEQIYENALFEITTNGREAQVCNIDHHTNLSSDEMITIEENYLKKEGVFKVSFNEQTIDVYFFEPVNYETVEDLANLHFGDFLVSKPKKVHINNLGLVVSESE